MFYTYFFILSSNILSFFLIFPMYFSSFCIVLRLQSWEYFQYFHTYISSWRKPSGGTFMNELCSCSNRTSYACSKTWQRHRGVGKGWDNIWPNLSIWFLPSRDAHYSESVIARGLRQLQTGSNNNNNNISNTINSIVCSFIPVVILPERSIISVMGTQLGERDFITMALCWCSVYGVKSSVE